LPEFYSRQWLNGSGELFRFSKPFAEKFECRRVTPGAIGYEIDLYTIPGVPEGQAQLIEQRFFSGVDDLAAKAMAQLLSGAIPTDTKIRSAWSRFLMSFSFRAPEDLSALKEAHRLVWNRPNPEIQAKYLKQKRALDPDTIEEFAERDDPHTVEKQSLEVFMAVIDNPRIGLVLNNMTWDVIDVSNTSFELLTSDRPLIRSNGLRPPQGHYALPISPTSIFLATHGNEMRTRALAMSPKQLARNSNRNVVGKAVRFVLGSSDQQHAFIEKHFADQPERGMPQALRDRYSNEAD
jgi:hypothetical protein